MLRVSRMKKTRTVVIHSMGTLVCLASLATPAATAQPVADTALACTKLPVFPHADFVQAFNDGDTVYVGINTFDRPDLAQAFCDVYVTENLLWTAFGAELEDVRGNPDTFFLPGGSMANNRFDLHDSAGLAAVAGEQIGVPYDVVVDANQNGVFDQGDLVDGVGVEGGFYKLRDLTAANAGTSVSIVDVALPIGRVAAGFESQRWYVPSNIAGRGQLPLILISHGAGHTFTGYDYLGLHFASFGYVVVAHANDVGGDDAGQAGVSSAATCTLDHANSLLALQATLQGGLLNGHLDAQRIVFVGHSRGGEGIVVGLHRLKQSLYSPTGGFPLVLASTGIKLLASIAPTTVMPSSEATPGTTPFHLVYGAGDSDVSGSGLFGAASQPFRILERAAGSRGSTYVHGAGHNDFFCCGDPKFTGPNPIGRIEAQRVAKAALLAAATHHVDGCMPCAEVLWRQYETFRPIGVASTTVVASEFREVPGNPALRFVIDDFQSENDLEISSSGGGVGMTVSNAFEGQMRDNPDVFYSFCGSAGTEAMNGMTRVAADDVAKCLVFDHPNPGSKSLAWSLATTNLSSFRYLSLRACQQTRHPQTLAFMGNQTFEVMLLDAQANTSRISIGAYGGGVGEPYQRSEVPWCGPGWQNEFETIRIRLQDFRADGRSVNLSNIVAIYLLFGSAYGTPAGRIAVDDLELVAD